MIKGVTRTLLICMLLSLSARAWAADDEPPPRPNVFARYFKNLYDNFRDCFYLRVGGTKHDRPHPIVPPIPLVYIGLPEPCKLETGSGFGLGYNYFVGAAWVLDGRATFTGVEELEQSGWPLKRFVYSERQVQWGNSYVDAENRAASPYAYYYEKWRERNLEVGPTSDQLGGVRAYDIDKNSPTCAGSNITTVSRQRKAYARLPHGWRRWEMITLNLGFVDQFVTHLGFDVGVGLDISQGMDFLLSVVPIPVLSRIIHDDELY